MDLLATPSEVLTYLGKSNPTSQQTLVAGIVVRAQMGAFVNYLGYNPIQSVRTEYLPLVNDPGQRDPLIDNFESLGGGGIGSMTRLFGQPRVTMAWRNLMLSALPVRSVASIYENRDAWLTPGGDWPESSLVDPSDYYLDLTRAGWSDSGMVIRNSGPWERTPRSIKVTYTGGLTPDEITDQKPNLIGAFYLSCSTALAQAFMLMSKLNVGEGGGIVAGESLGDWSISYDTATNAKLFGATYNAISAPAMALLGSQDVNLASYIQ